jgi:hypothetical protein
VLASNGYQIRALPTEADVPKFVFPLEVIGPVNFLLLVVWSKRKQKYRYVMGIVKAIRIYRDLIRNSYWRFQFECDLGRLAPSRPQSFRPHHATVPAWLGE